MLFADLHIHSRYSRATSKDLNIENLERFARIKGLNLLGTGDFTHPKWFSELKEKLSDDGTGILKTKNNFKFVLQTEISLVYSQDKKIRKVHLILLAKNFEIVNQINSMLLRFGRLDYDGRPTFGAKAYEIVELLKEIDKNIEIIPAHIWTPWFSVFGSNSGFNSLEECFKDQTKNIFALETGLSSDPEMNWKLSKLDSYTLVSNSDSHSYWPYRIGRECNVFDLNEEELSYEKLINSIRTRKNFLMTIEVDPAYGKYHFDGHRNCNVILNPEESIKFNNICPICHKKLTVGVLHRVFELSDRKEFIKPENAIGFKRILPLQELISLKTEKGVLTKENWEIYNKLISAFGNEFNVLLNVEMKELMNVVGKDLAELIMSNRSNKIAVKPGYDGVYGVPIINNAELKILEDNDKEADKEAKKTKENEEYEEVEDNKSEKVNKEKNNKKQKKLFDFK
ncbi:MAG: endonuclease Q family protein [Candidatus Woesearchaeota archaeon]